MQQQLAGGSILLQENTRPEGTDADRNVRLQGDGKEVYEGCTSGRGCYAAL